MATTEFIGVPIHQDVTSFEEKPFGPLTGRQALYLSAAGALGFAVGFVTIQLMHMNMDVASLFIMAVAVPVGMLAFIKPDDLSPMHYATLLASHALVKQRLEFRGATDPMCRTFQGRRVTDTQDKE